MRDLGGLEALVHLISPVAAPVSPAGVCLPQYLIFPNIRSMCPKQFISLRYMQRWKYIGTKRSPVGKLRTVTPNPREIRRRLR
jgi:hypothetical protein